MSTSYADVVDDFAQAINLWSQVQALKTRVGETNTSPRWRVHSATCPSIVGGWIGCPHSTLQHSMVPVLHIACAWRPNACSSRVVRVMQSTPVKCLIVNQNDVRRIQYVIIAWISNFYPLMESSSCRVWHATCRSPLAGTRAVILGTTCHCLARMGPIAKHRIISMTL